MKLNIQLFASGTVDNFTKVKGTSSATLQGKIEWSSVGDATTNKSIVTTKLYARRTDNYTSTPTSGKNWGGKVKVGNNEEHKFTGFDKDTPIGSKWVLFATYTDEIEHDTDGTCTITISGSVTGPTGTSLAGKTSSGSKTFELDRLHKLPDEVTFDILEVNEKLINASVNNDTFVKDLSIKSFNINGNTYDNATIKEYGILNRIVPYGTATLPLIIDFSQNEILTDLTYVTKVPITGRIIDSYDTAGFSETLLFDYVPYNKIKLVETSTAVKRNGQTSGKVRLNINGNLYNGIVGNVDQSTYKPIVKYKFWQTGTEEPISYDYEIPSDNITIENGVFSVSNYEIGSSVETDINWFNPENAYKVKIYVEDNFTSYESQEKSIALGESTWTEYKNRVDFKKITKKNKEILDYEETEEKFYYKDGDKYILPANTYINVGGCLTASKAQVRFGIFTPKSLKNITSITVNYAKLAIRSSAGGYILNMVEVTDKIYTEISGENAIYLSYQPSSAMSGTNNTPVAVEINGLELTFNIE